MGSTTLHSSPETLGKARAALHRQAFLWRPFHSTLHCSLLPTPICFPEVPTATQVCLPFSSLLSPWSALRNASRVAISPSLKGAPSQNPGQETSARWTEKGLRDTPVSSLLAPALQSQGSRRRGRRVTSVWPQGLGPREINSSGGSGRKETPIFGASAKRRIATFPRF